VLFGAALLGLAAHWRGGDPAHLAAGDFAPAYWAIACVTLLSLLWFVRLDPNAGAELRGPAS